jgi:phage recombination protein Bet
VVIPADPPKGTKRKDIITVNGNNKVSTDLVLRTAQEHGFTSTAVELIRNVAAKGRTDEEVAQLLIMAGKTGLDPLARQIYMIGRYDSRAGREIATPQTSIDGYRLIADRTERYSPGRETTYTYDEDGRIVSATAYVKKLVAGTWHEVAATAFWDEYKQTNKQGNPTALWAKMPHVMLGKCAESLALRRAFPAELSGLYTAEEMAQASQDDAIEAVVTVAAPVVEEPQTDPLIDFKCQAEDITGLTWDELAPRLRVILKGKGIPKSEEARERLLSNLVDSLAVES